MQKMLSLLILAVFWNCSNGFFSELFHKNKTTFPLPILISGVPKVTLPDGIPSDSLRIKEDSNVPRLLGRSQVPVGKIYDISFEFKKKGGNESLSYKSLYFAKPVELEFPVDLDGLESKGFTNEFYVWYKDFATNEWKVLQKGILDQNTSSVKVQTKHFTPFILSALPYLPGTEIAAASSCFTTEAASWNLQGVLDDSSVSQAKFGTIGEGYRYYQDRPYFVKENEGAFREIGLEFALLVPTCQGGTGTCGNSLLHSESTSAEYLAFDAPKNIDVYVMYDTRGGISPADTSQDADWLSGFTLLTGKYVYTTEPGLDPAQTIGASGYKIYKKTFPQGSRVSLGGNKKGTIAPGISSNYWVVVKPAGIEGGVQPAAILCDAGPDPREPDVVSGQTFPGSDRILFWLGYPPTNGPKKIIIRRSEISPPLSPASGEEPTGTEITPYSYLDTGLVEGHTYYYSIFAVNDEGMYSGITIGMETTGPDTDGDGLSDEVEINYWFSMFDPDHTMPPPVYARAIIPDCDGDGINDGMEFAQGTHPCSDGNSIPPVVTVNHLSENASSGIIDLEIKTIDEATGDNLNHCYIRQLEPGMTEEEFLRKPFAVPLEGYLYNLTPGFTLNRWIVNCSYANNRLSFRLGKLGGGLPDRFAIWGRDREGNISEPVIREFKAREANANTSFMLNPMDFETFNSGRTGILSVSFDPLKDPLTHDLLGGISIIPFYDSQYNYIKKIGHVIPVKNTKGYHFSSAYDLASFIAITNNVASYYEPKTTPGLSQTFVKKNEIPIDYQFSKSRPQAVHFPTQSGTDAGIAALYSGSTNLQQSLFKIEGGYLTAISSSLPGIPSGFYPRFILPYDFGQGFGLLNGNQFQEFALDSWTTPLYQTFGLGIIDSNFSDVISIDKLNRYNPQNEAETYAVLKPTSPTDFKILYRKSGDLNFTSIPITEVPAHFIGFQTIFTSYLDFTGTPVYHLYLLGRQDITGGKIMLLRYKISSSGGIPNYAFDQNLNLTNGYNRIVFDNSGRYLFGIGSNLMVDIYLMSEEYPKLTNRILLNNTGENLQLAFVPKEPVNIENIGGYSKIRLIQTAGYTDYQRYGFLPAGSELIFRNHIYDSKSNECTSPSVPGTANVIATATGNYGVPPIPLAVVNDNVTIQNAHKVQAPSSAATLVLESTYTQSSNACRTGLVANDTASIPVRTKVVQNTTSVYKDYSLNPASVPSSYNDAPAPAGYDTAEFKKWEPLSKSSPQRHGIYIRKVIYVWWPYIAVIDEGNPCIVGDVTIPEGQLICNVYFGGYPLFVEDFVYPYDKYTFTGQYVYSGDKLITAP
ncbi:hypothetical protein ACO2KH_18545 [Leptospira terpstrae]|uniref:hypothetical protein n=1 Tax=Leptospira terpstrae TaxID=293075 RepID=UPI003CFDA00A